jgi:hypothetical protein
MNLREARQVLDSVQTDSDAAGGFGEAFQTADGAMVIPVTSPKGIFVVKDGAASWVAAVNSERVALMGILVGLVSATLACLAMVRRPPWPDVHVDVERPQWPPLRRR